MSEKDARPRILVVDDQTANLQVVGGVLNNAGKYRISFAQSGGDALKLMESIEPDLLLLDVMMPGMGGYEMCRQLKQNPKRSNIPVIFLTAKSDVRDVLEGFEAGGADYITKPFEPTVLLARVETHLQLYLYHQQEELLRGQERISAYHNGLIEMGAAVLHNIGNGMVSVDSRIAPIQNVADALMELADMLEKAKANFDKDGDQQRLLKIMGLSAALLREEHGKKLGEESYLLGHAAEHIRQIINAQRELTSNQGLISSHFYLSSLISDIGMLVNSQLEERKIGFKTIEEKGMPQVFLPRSPLGQMMVNLIKNSYEAISEKGGEGGAESGTITIEVEQLEQELPENGGEPERTPFWRLRVTDNGSGITSDHLDKVVRSGYSTKVRGSGLGLHSAANFAYALGGQLSVMSEGSGKGAVVEVTLPVECKQNCYQLDSGSA
ncbi:MAG: hybrid sensor histidine kinase/response regulator [Gammaproteobacteria bacterium]|nr:hybrid sensor histidine kinase/response regulator [Gammaproteobacteria bacterium]